MPHRAPEFAMSSELFFFNRKKDYQSFKTQNQEAQQPLERHTLVFMKEKATHEFNNLLIKLMVFF